MAFVLGSTAIVAFGIGCGWSSPYTPYLLSSSSTIRATSDEVSWCAVAPLGGCLLGALLCSKMMDMLGRKWTLLFLSPLSFFGFLGMAFIRHIWYLSAMRFLIGIGGGADFTILPLYIAETVDPDLREFLTSIVYCLFIVGTILINAIGPFVDIYTSSIICSVVPAIHFITFLFMPESPYHYVKVGKHNLAEKSLTFFKSSQKVQEELKRLQDSIEEENKMSSKSKFTDLFTIPSNRRACYISLILMLSNRVSGKTPISLFTASIFEESGGTLSPTVLVLIYYTVEFFVIVFTISVITKIFGRRPLMILSCAGCSLSNLALAIYFYLQYCDYSSLNSLTWLPITSLVSYIISFGVGLSYGPMSYLGEIFPMNVKANASSIGVLFIDIMGIFFGQFFHITFKNFGIHVPFFCFSIFSGICTILIFKMVPETRGKTLEDIQILLRKKSAPSLEKNNTK